MTDVSQFPPEFQDIEWHPATLAFYEHLKQTYGDLEATNYLKVSYRISVDRKPLRELEIISDPFHEQRDRVLSLYSISNHLKRSDPLAGRRAVYDAILQLIHPEQLPISWRDIEYFFRLNGYQMSSQGLQRRLRHLAETGDLITVPNPYKGNRLLYCHPDFKSDVQVGDRVLLLVQRRAARAGDVVGFKEIAYGKNVGQLAPVIDWKYRLKDGKSLPYSGVPSFADPANLVIIDRPKSTILQRRVG